jgi:hypothetical protein
VAENVLTLVFGIEWTLRELYKSYIKLIFSRRRCQEVIGPLLDSRPVRKLRNTTVRILPILLKNSFSIDDGKILGAMRREARFRLGGYMNELMSRCRTSRAAYEAKPG